MGASGGLPVRVVEDPAELLLASDVAHLRKELWRLDEFVLDPLMIAPMTIILGEGRDGGPEMLFAQEDQATQTLFLN